MTSKEMEAKCIALMKKLGLFDDEDKLKEWVRDYVVYTDSASDELVVVKRSEFKPNEMDFDCVLCARFDPFLHYEMRPGSTVQNCHDCTVPIVVSADSPADPPKVCRECAIIRRNKSDSEQSINE